MKAVSIILLYFVAAVWSHDGCGYRAPDVTAIEAMAHRERHLQASNPSPRALFRCDACRGSRFRTIDTYIHVIQMMNETGCFADAVLEESIQVTNELLLSTGFQLKVVSTNRITNDVWYFAESQSDEEMDMTHQLKQGGLDTLNIYYKAAIVDGNRVCGYANLAEDAFYWPDDDGVVVDTRCATNKTILAHEFGHWMNLLHTFDGGCSPGDLVDDTNGQAMPMRYLSDECPDPLPDTCPDAGFDPLDNIMDYAPSGCGDIFTPGQVQRMQDAWRNIRRA